MNNNTHVIIMAGGIGSRFWPMSRSSFPKQFHDVLGTGRTLIQQTADRFGNICPEQNIWVVTSDSYMDLVKEQLPFMDEAQILCEPARKNTAPCVLFAAKCIEQINPDAQLIVAPADHLIMNTPEFERIIQIALDAALGNNKLLTLGIKPSRPDTGYGYIQFVDDNNASCAELKKVKTFTEKPTKEIAKQFLASGEFYWNSGIFVWSLATILAEFESHLPDMFSLFQEQNGNFGSAARIDAIEDIYNTCPNISIDYGILEKSSTVDVVLSDFGWSDLGTWGSLYTHVPKDDKQNAIIGNNVMIYDGKKNIVNVPKNKLVVLQGLTDYIVVESNDILLVCKKEDEQKIKQIVTDIKTEKGEKFV